MINAKQNTITRLRALISDAVKKAPAVAREQASDPLDVVVEITPKARALREASRITQLYGWPDYITSCLDRFGVSCTADLSEEQALSMREELQHFVDCVQTGCDASEAPPAR